MKEYDDPFLVWRYGPVVETVHEHYHLFGASALFLPEKENGTYEHLNATIKHLLTKKGSELITESQKHAHWKKHETDIHLGKSNVPYSLEDLENIAVECPTVT